MQLCLSDISQTADDDLETIEMLLTPEPSPDSDATEASEQLFNAVSACADLHPDPDEDDDQEQEPMPGAGGWITSDNMDQFVDENGDFRMPRGSSLGVGAGTVRTADQFEDANNDYDDEDDDDDDDNDDDNHDVDNGADGEETKWRRTS
jgi:nucleotide-sensitive chloride channel 1A